MKTGIELIAEEREKQININNWTPEHDDQHTACDLAVVAAQCATHGTDATVNDPLDRNWGIVERYGYSSPTPDRIHLLAIAGALIAAEIDRLQRKHP